MTHRRTKPRIFLTPHAELLRRAREQARYEHRSVTSIVEQALAELFAIPLANPELPEAPAELCPSCERGVIFEGRCPVCGWHRYPRPWVRTGTRTRAPQSRHTNGAKVR